MSSEDIARRFHETYERLAPEFGYETRKESAVPWEEVPEQNRNLMIAVVSNLLDNGVIHYEDRQIITSPDVPIEIRLERHELAIAMLSTWLVQAQTGFTPQDAEAVERILRGEIVT